ncbi:amidohydrolase [Bacillus sp. B15-48]|uniref:M20 metallopeptidase family protein n=1 Tax=Bacillus sp. B15-48 TaxID=1548601 RepID=UPI00193F5ABE|nr:amidohydrolase [Bacillus sp. B15-48]
MLQNGQLIEQVNKRFNQIVTWRRYFHQYPELSFMEFGTSKFVAENLQTIKGMKVEKGLGVETSVVGTLKNGHGPTIALRADLDALPISEQNQTEYASKVDGVMHACGHDAHTSILLGVAHILGEIFQQKEIFGTVKFIFQPGEESTDDKGLSGAPYMIEAGVYDEVDMAMALHMCPWLPVGAIQLNDGYSMANVDEFKGKIFGTGGHGAYPDLGTDPIWILSTVMQSIYGIISRRVSALDAGVISVGKINGGTANNVIPSEVTFEGTIRSYTPEVRELLAEELKRALSISETMGGSYSLQIQNGEPALKNHSFVNRLIERSIREIFPEFTIMNGKFGMGGEDFGYVSQKLPSSMFFLGCASKNGVKKDLHTPTFDIDERCLSIGTAILTKSVLKVLRKDVNLSQLTIGGATE